MTKSRKKILLSSIAMLLVALVALGSATYAWFTINKVVTADSIKVQAVVAEGLVISNKQTRTSNNNADRDNYWGAKASFSSSTTGLEAASMNIEAENNAFTTTLTGGNQGTSMFYAKDVKQSGAYDEDGYENGPTASHFDTAKLVSKTAYAQDENTYAFAANTYSAAYTFWLASSGEAMTGKTITAAITSTDVTANKNANTFMKAALCDSTGAVIGFWNNGGYKAVTAVAQDGTPTISETNAAAEKTTGIVALSNGAVPTWNETTAANQLSYTLYVWCEGNDEDCNNDHSGYDTNFTVTFTLAD